MLRLFLFYRENITEGKALKTIDPEAASFYKGLGERRMDGELHNAMGDIYLNYMDIPESMVSRSEFAPLETAYRNYEANPTIANAAAFVDEAGKVQRIANGNGYSVDSPYVRVNAAIEADAVEALFASAEAAIASGKLDAASVQELQGLLVEIDSVRSVGDNDSRYISINYVERSKELGKRLEIDGYSIIKTKTAEQANIEWAKRGYTSPPIASGTMVYNVKAGGFKYARVYCSNSKSRPKSPFLVRADDIKGLTAKEIYNKYALPQIPDKIVYPFISSETPLEVSIIGEQEFNGVKTFGGEVQYTIKDVVPKDEWFLPFVEDLK